MNTTNPESPPSLLSPFRGFSHGWSRYAEFRGRSSRVEYWSFTIINLFISFLFFEASFILMVIHQMVALIPSISVWVRRLHDINCSGWWVFWAFASPAAILLVIYVEKSGAIPTTLPDGIEFIGDGSIPLALAVMFVIVMNLIATLMCFIDGDPGTNEYGPNPKLSPDNPSQSV